MSDSFAVTCQNQLKPYGPRVQSNIDVKLLAINVTFSPRSHCKVTELYGCNPRIFFCVKMSQTRIGTTRACQQSLCLYQNM